MEEKESERCLADYRQGASSLCSLTQMNHLFSYQGSAWVGVLLLWGLSQPTRAEESPAAQPKPIAAVSRSLADEKPEAFLRRAYPGSRVALDPRFATASGVFRAYFVALSDGRFVRAELETQFQQVATRKGNGAARAFLALTEKPLHSPFTWKVVADAAGPVRLGMMPAAISQACAEYPVLVERVTRKRNGQARPVLAVSHFGKPLLLLETAGPTVSRIEVLDRRLTTPQGLGSGSTLSELAERYGTGELLLGPEGISVIFASSCSGRAFKLAEPAPSPGTALRWETLLKRNPQVASVWVAGSAGAFAAETRATGLPRARQSRAGEPVEAFLKRAYPGCTTAYDAFRSSPREGYRRYLVRTPAGAVVAAELKPSPVDSRGGGTKTLVLTPTEVRQPYTWQVTSRSLGPIGLGMHAAQVGKACESYAVTLQRTTVLDEGEWTAALVVSSFGKPLAELVLSARNDVEFIRVRDPRLKTPQSAGVGTSVRELARLYGTGEVLLEEGDVSVVFDRRCPGRIFRLVKAGKAPLPNPNWKSLVKANAKVDTLWVVGQE